MAAGTTVGEMAYDAVPIALLAGIVTVAQLLAEPLFHTPLESNMFE
jgi:hypothetical protein